jgi:hypothetical protein
MANFIGIVATQEVHMVAPSKTGAPTKKETQHNVTFAEGGDTPMFGKGDRTKTDDPAGEQTAGQTAADPKDNPKYAEGGSTKMFGFNPAVKATGGITGPR